MILAVCMSPCTDVTIELDSLNVGRTNIVKNKTRTYSGKALNVAIGVKRLGGEPYLTGVMYNENGYMFENTLDKEGVPFSFVWNPGRVRENYKFIDNHYMLTEVNDVGAEVSEEKAVEVLQKVRTLSAKSSVTVVSGGLPRGMSSEFYGSLLRAVSPTSLKVTDASGGRLLSALNVGVDLIKPNLQELENTLGRKIVDRDDILEGCYDLLDMGAKRVLLSMGEEGAIITDGTHNYFCKSTNVAVNSTVGAGDGMVAAASLALERDAHLAEILRAGVAAGTATVTTVGQMSFTKEKYDEIYPNLRISEF